MPIYYWNKYRDSHKGKYLVKEVYKASKVKKFIFHFIYGVKFLIKPNSFNIDFYSKAWNKLYQQYIDKFGYDEGFKEKIELMVEKFDLITEYFDKPHDKRDRFIITKIKAIDLELESIDKGKTKGNKIDFEAVKVYVDKWLNAYLDDKVCSVVQYQYYLQEMSKPQKQSSVDASN